MKQLVSFETAKLAKQKGFDIPCNYWYNDTDTDMDENNNHIIRTGSLHNHNHPMDAVTISAPTLCVLHKWLRETFQIFVGINVNDFGHDWYFIENYHDIWHGKYKSMPGGATVYNWGYYELCLDNGLFEALKVTKTKRKQ